MGSSIMKGAFEEDRYLKDRIGKRRGELGSLGGTKQNTNRLLKGLSEISLIPRTFI